MNLKIQRFLINTAYAWNICKLNTMNDGFLDDRVSLHILFGFVIFDCFTIVTGLVGQRPDDVKELIVTCCVCVLLSGN